LALSLAEKSILPGIQIRLLHCLRPRLRLCPIRLRLASQVRLNRPARLLKAKYGQSNTVTGTMRLAVKLPSLHKDRQASLKAKLLRLNRPAPRLRARYGQPSTATGTMLNDYSFSTGRV